MTAISASALLLACPPIPIVRIGLIGLGERGLKTLKRYSYIDGAEIRAIADLKQENLQKATDILKNSNRPEATCYITSDGWKKICERDDIDLVYICTEWDSHTSISVYAMQHGKHVAVEVPAASTLEECRLLVSTAEQTRRHCFMTENCCYDLFALSTLEMKGQGLFGDITHLEGAYIHNLRSHLGIESQAASQTSTKTWMETCCATHDGNPYPTHGMGPIGWLLNLHRGDRMDYLVSLTSKGEGTDHLLGKINSTLIRTVQGKSILLQFDITTPRPYNRLQTICGTKGFAQKYPIPTFQFEDAEPLIGDAALQKAELFETSKAAKCWHEGKKLGVENEMNYAMDRRLIHCLHEGLPLDIDVYDAAEWSCISELSKISAQQGSRPVKVPDFTNGHWQDLNGFKFF